MAEDLGCRNRFHGDDVTGARNDDVGIFARYRVLIAGPVPDAEAFTAVRFCFVRGEPLELRLLVLDDNVHAVLRVDVYAETSRRQFASGCR